MIICEKVPNMKLTIILYLSWVDVSLHARTHTQFLVLRVVFINLGMVSEAIGVLAAVIVQGQLVTKYQKSDDCGDGGKVPESEINNEVK